jgi:hypothetical protein
VLARAPDYQFGQAHETNRLPPQELACPQAGLPAYGGPRRSVATLSPR